MGRVAARVRPIRADFSRAFLQISAEACGQSAAPRFGIELEWYSEKRLVNFQAISEASVDAGLLVLPRLVQNPAWICRDSESSCAGSD